MDPFIATSGLESIHLFGHRRDECFLVAVFNNYVSRSDHNLWLLPLPDLWTVALGDETYS